ncbi:CobW family GTP-binding protein [Halalkalibacter urbisdiaboli]|uniref:CobW family GTP-binding protein n=1 Tax=Halalkalibacter urbisdiaboli TaxID=1960589 RepID=UPI000B4532C1|nr:GTP-binding protein [Halalkalibacter urbisdiaboli]
MVKPIPTYLLTGFLGSGKTTVLKRLLTTLKREGKKVVLVFNELGEENVEKHYFSDETMLELLNGCICCTIQDDMRMELQQFLKTNQAIDVLIIEGTGIANPVEVIEALTHPVLIEKVDLMSVISLIDVSHFLEYQSLFSSSKEIRRMLKQQITFSSLLLLNKIDLVNHQKLEKVKLKISSLKREQAPMLECKYGEVDPHYLLERRMVTFTNEETHHHHSHHHPFQALKLSVTDPIDKKKFEHWLKRQGETLLRAKGFVRILHSDSLYSFQYASKQINFSEAEEDMEMCIILIGTGLIEKEIRESFEKEVKNRSDWL